jgi:DNA polymerase-4
VAFGVEKQFLAPLSIRKIPMVGEKTYIQLRNMGVPKIQTIQEMTPDTMQRILGANGMTI